MKDTKNAQCRRLIDEGDVSGVERLLASDPVLARESLHWGDHSGDHPTAPINYVSLARFHGLGSHERWGELARALLAAGAPVDGDPADGESPLITAASYGEGEVARVLIEAGADLEATGFAVPDGTALGHAVEFGNVKIVDLLVAAGARIHDIVEAAGAGDLRGFLTADTPMAERIAALRAAAVCERRNAIDDLLAAGTPIDGEYDGSTALHAAAWNAKAKSVRHLLERGANPNRRDREYKSTPLGWCRHRGAELAAYGPVQAYAAVEAMLEPVTDPND